MENHIAANGVRRFHLTIPAGEVLPGEDIALGARIVAPPSDAPPARTAFYCLPGGQMDLTYFDLGSDDDRRFSLAEALALQGNLVILVDHPGIGGSTMPRDEWALTPDLLAAVHASASRETFAGLRDGSLVPDIAPAPDLVPIGLGHSMGAVVTIEVQAAARPFSGLVLLGYGTGGLPDILPPDAVEDARDPNWLRNFLPELARERFGTALIDPRAARDKRRGKAKGSPSFHTDNADPDGKAALRGAAAPLLTLPGLFSMFPGVSDATSAEIDVPILIVTGTHDFVEANDSLRNQFSSSPNIEIFRPENTGHNLFIFPSREESYAAIADWASRFVPA